IHSNYVFTKKVRKEMSIKQQWGKRFGIIKKTLDLAITTGCYEELCEMHLKLMKEIEMQLLTRDSHNILDDDPAQFAATVSKPHTKQVLYKRVKVGSASQMDCSDTSNMHRNELRDITAITKNISRHCGICGQVGHNAHTCNSDGSSNQMVNMSRESYNNQNDDLSLSTTKHIENSNFKNADDINYESKSRHCGTCSQTGHNARTCNSDNSSKQMNGLTREYNTKENDENSNSM
ncbi:17537_t:CDS:2, partial [Racocetra fulgida]